MDVRPDDRRNGMDARSEAPARILGLDVGERRIGVAVSEGRLAVPLTVIEHTVRAADIASVVAFAEREGATAIVVGLPLAPDGGEGEQARLTRAFGKQLSARTALPILYQDERLSSVDAGAVRGRRGKPIDDLAAAAILQRYIDAIETAR